MSLLAALRRRTAVEDVPIYLTHSRSTAAAAAAAAKKKNNERIISSNNQCK
jgi:hypothetical protein